MTTYIGTARFEGQKTPNGPILKMTCDYVGTSHEDVRQQAEDDAIFYGVPISNIQIRPLQGVG